MDITVAECKIVKLKYLLGSSRFNTSRAGYPAAGNSALIQKHIYINICDS